MPMDTEGGFTVWARKKRKCLYGIMVKLLPLNIQAEEEETKMWEYEIINNKTGAKGFIYGYSKSDALERSKLNPAEWTIIAEDFID